MKKYALILALILTVAATSTVLPTAGDWNWWPTLQTWLLTDHNADGTHGDLNASSINLTDANTTLTGAAGVLSVEGVKVEKVYDVRRYAATGDGATDDELAIEAAIIAAAANGGTVYFPTTGNAYKFLTAITVPSNVTLQFAPGASIMGDGSSILTINGSIVDTQHQIFQSTMTVQGNLVTNKYNVRWWATGDGVTNDTAAIQAAVDAADAAGGGIVFFPIGTYEATHIDLADDVSIVGAGWSTIIHQVTGTDVRTTADGLLAINKDNTDGSVDDVVIRDIQLQADVLTIPHAGTDEHNHLIMTANALNLTIDNVKFYGWKGDAICLGAQGTPTVATVATNVQVTNCYFDGITQKTRQAISILSAADVLIDHCFIKNTTAAGMPAAIVIEPELVTAYTRNITISNSSFQNIGPVGTLKPPFIIDFGNLDNTNNERRGRITFTKNYVNTASGISIKSVGATDTAEEPQFIEITNNMFDTMTGTMTLGPVYGLDISGNTFLSCGQMTVGPATYLATSVKIKDNIFDTCQNGGATIGLQFADDVDISGNSFIDCGADGGVGVNVIFLSTSTIDNLRIHNNVFSTPGAVTTGDAVYNNAGTQDTASDLYDNILEDGITLQTGWTAGLGHLTQTVALLSTTTISFAADLDTVIYTVPSSKNCVLHYAVIVAGADAGATTTISIGRNGTETDFLGNQTLSNLDVALDAVIIAPIQSAIPVQMKSYATGIVIDARVASNSGGATNTLYLYGQLY